MNNKVKSILHGFNELDRSTTKERQGWLDWGVQGRIESNGEHSNSAAILAYQIYAHNPEKYPDINILRVMQMLTFHDTVEAFMPDFTPFSGITEEQKRQQTNESIDKVAALFPNEFGTAIHAMLTEFEDAKTPDGHYAKMVDKLQAALKSRIYDKHGNVDLANDKAQEMLKKHDVHGRGHKQLSDSWLAYETEKDLFDKTFLEIAQQAQETRSEKLQQFTSILKQVQQQKQDQEKE